MGEMGQGKGAESIRVCIVGQCWECRVPKIRCLVTSSVFMCPIFCPRRFCPVFVSADDNISVASLATN